ncbi:hypothetical protein ACIODS_12135 [Micromonospora chalcea]|uniref:hypothetical protein n=1 Tax=Micromonospora chalcea TaxID=1874 RepID=UPI0038117A16
MLCNIVYAYQRRELLQALAMADGKDRVRVLEQFDTDLYAPLGGWEAADRQLHKAIGFG